MKLKGLHFADVAEIQEAVTDELKKVQKENFSAVFRNCTTAKKPVYMPMEIILKKKQSNVNSMFKKSALKLVDRSVHLSIRYRYVVSNREEL
jgi:hypothetical protein